MTDLQLGFHDVIYILEEIQNKKKLPIEIIEKTGEVEVGKVSKKIKAISQKKEEKILKSSITEKDVKEEKIEEIKHKYECSNCGREMGEVYKYCPGCGRPLKKID
jgi:Zn finger protein HypA/HybF involved in hydrogenase expression